MTLVFDPVLVREDGQVKALDTVDAALALLRARKEEPSTPEWLSAYWCCEYAKESLVTGQTVRRAFERWCRINGLLAAESRAEAA